MTAVPSDLSGFINGNLKTRIFKCIMKQQEPFTAQHILNQLIKGGNTMSIFPVKEVIRFMVLRGWLNETQVAAKGKGRRTLQFTVMKRM